jgi:hypothetical protein
MFVDIPEAFYSLLLIINDRLPFANLACSFGDTGSGLGDAASCPGLIFFLIAANIRLS